MQMRSPGRWTYGSADDPGGSRSPDLDRHRSYRHAQRHVAAQKSREFAKKTAPNRGFYDSIRPWKTALKLPEDIDALHATLLATRVELAIVRAQQSDGQALIANLKVQIEKLNRDRYGPRSERSRTPAGSNSN